MSAEKRPIWEVRLDNLKRLFVWRYLAKNNQMILVSEYPKSGASWLCQMIADVTNLPFQRNVNVKLKPSILHSHFMHSDNYYKVIGVTRDGRDIMVSYYYHVFFKNDRNSEFIVNKFRKNLPFEDYNDIERNLPRFIEYMFTEYSKSFLLKGITRFTWVEFAEAYAGKPNACLVKYEDMLKDSPSVLDTVMRFIEFEDYTTESLQRTADKFSFKNLSKRKPGQEDKKSFLRKGIHGDWKNKFTTEAAEVFNHYGGNALIQLGYEQNYDWVKQPLK